MAHAEQIFLDVLHTVAKDHNIHNYDLTIKSISSGAGNYTSHLFFAKVSERKEIKLFGKVAAFGEKAREYICINMYSSEIYFYSILAKAYHEIEEKSKLAEEERLKIPKFYGCNATLYEETIVLEDLGCRGFTILDRMKYFDWDYASAAVSQMAKFHALSMAYQRDNKEAFDDVDKKLNINWEDIKDYKTVCQTYFKPALEAVSEENKEKLKRYLETNYETNRYPEMIGAKKVKVILHGDYRPNNLMHRTRADGKLEIIPVDFQTLCVGSPVVDLLYFIFLGSDEEFRRLHYQELVDHYYSELSGAMTRLGIDPGTYSKEDFDEELKEKMSYGIHVAIFLLPLITVEAEDAPRPEEDMDETIFAVNNPGKLFQERFNGILNDYVRWGILT